MREEYVAQLRKRVNEVKDLKIPTDIREGGYRWGLYVYCNICRKSPPPLDVKDKVALIEVWKTLQDEHTIFWSRNFLMPVKKDLLVTYHKFLMRVIYTDRDWVHFLIALYLLRCYKKKRFYVGDYEYHHLPGVSKYVEA